MFYARKFAYLFKKLSHKLFLMSCLWAKILSKTREIRRDPNPWLLNQESNIQPLSHQPSLRSPLLLKFSFSRTMCMKFGINCGSTAFMSVPLIVLDFVTDKSELILNKFLTRQHHKALKFRDWTVIHDDCSFFQSRGLPLANPGSSFISAFYVGNVPSSLCSPV